MTLRKDLQLMLRHSRRLALVILFALMPAIYLLSGFYSVGAEERGLVSRFGRVVEENVAPGMHYHLPWPFESARTIQVTTLRSMDIDFAGTAPEHLQPELTTGDEDLVDVSILIQYNISDPARFVRTSENAEDLLRYLSLSETLYYISAEAIDQLLTTGRTSLQNHLKTNIQHAVTELGLGIRLTSVQIRRLEPPASIKRAFDNVAQARSDKHKRVQESISERNSRLAEARSRANAVRESARAHATEVVAQAEGDRDHFLAILREYKKSPGLTQQRVYLEKLEAILAKVHLTLIKPSQAQP